MEHSIKFARSFCAAGAALLLAGCGSLKLPSLAAGSIETTPQAAGPALAAVKPAIWVGQVVAAAGLDRMGVLRGFPIVEVLVRGSGPVPRDQRGLGGGLAGLDARRHGDLVRVLARVTDGDQRAG